MRDGIEREVQRFGDGLSDAMPRTTEVSLLREIARQTFRNGLLLEEILERLSDKKGLR